MYLLPMGFNLLYKVSDKLDDIIQLPQFEKQLPPSFYELILKKTLNTIITKPEDKQEETEEE